MNPINGMKLRVDLIYLDILNPSEDLYNKLTIKNSGNKLAEYQIFGVTNLYSSVYEPSFKNFSGLFSGDMPGEISNKLASSGVVGTANYIRIPHHGSANRLTDNLLKVLMPKLAVISVDNNMWNFPQPEIIEM